MFWPERSIHRRRQLGGHISERRRSPPVLRPWLIWPSPVTVLTPTSGYAATMSCPWSRTIFELITSVPSINGLVGEAAGA